MARSLCPFKKGQCGEQKNILFNNSNEQANIDMTIPAGGVCMVEMRAKCGMPAFKPENMPNGTRIQYAQFDDEDAEIDGPP